MALTTAENMQCPCVRTQLSSM